MSTNSVVGYKDETGTFRGTYVHWDGDTVGAELSKSYGKDREKLVAWIENGIKGGGYSSYDSESYGESEDIWAMEQAQSTRHVEYVWQVLKSGTIVNRKKKN